VKIKHIKLKNFRGARTEAFLDIQNQESVLLYGDNGTGKSSFLDGIEWFITDNVSPLGGEEIEKHGGLRHTLSSENDESYVAIKFSSDIENTKDLEIAKGKLKASFRKTDATFTSMIEGMKNEKPWIRNSEIVSFILKTKKDRLSDISNIIGYEEVAKTKTILKKASNDIKSIIKNKNFEGQIANKKQLMAKKIGQTVNNKEQFYSAVEVLVKKILPNEKIQDEKTLKNAINTLKAETDSKQLVYRQSLESLNKEISDLLVIVTSSLKQVKNLKLQIFEIQQSSEDLSNISLIKLYEEASKILSSYNEDSCPLCLSTFKKSDLAKLIREKLKKLNDFSKKTKAIEQEKNQTIVSLRQSSSAANSCLNNFAKITPAIAFETTEIKSAITELDLIIREIEKSITDIDLSSINLNELNFSVPFNKLTEKLILLLKSTSTEDNSLKIDLIANITVAEQSFNDLLELENEKIILNKQYSTMDTIAADFNSKQRGEILTFLSQISKDLNEYYLFMNDGEKVDNIQLVTVDDNNGEFAGIALKIHFHNQEISSPKKYLSESHINCLGLSLFLSSVKLFNRNAKFIVLDDVISSFDKPHRYRFGQLLQEKFKDYQLIVLTHEHEWFELMASQVKGKGWQINTTDNIIPRGE